MGFHANVRSFYQSLIAGLWPDDAERVYPYEPEIWHWDGFAEAFDTGAKDATGKRIYRGFTVSVPRLPNQGTGCERERLYVVELGYYETLYDAGASAVDFGDRLEILLDALELKPSDLRVAIGPDVTRVEEARMEREIDTLIWPQGWYALTASVRQTVHRRR